MESKKQINVTKTVIDIENKQLVPKGGVGKGSTEIGERDYEVKTSSCKINE